MKKLIVILLFVFGCFFGNCQLIVENTRTIDSDMTVSGITMVNSNSKLIINPGVKLTITGDVSITKGCVENYGMIISSNDIHIHTNNDCSFENCGDIVCNRFNFGENTGYEGRVDGSKVSFTCNSSIRSSIINFYVIDAISLDGIFVANEIMIDSNNGGNNINIGKSGCGTTRLEVDKIIFKNGVSFVNFDEISFIGTLVNNSYSSLQLNIDGMLTIGNSYSGRSDQRIGFNGSSESIIDLCYNPTRGSQDFGGNGSTVKTSGIVIYRYDETDEHAWNQSAAVEEKIEMTNPEKLKKNIVEYAECIEGVTHFLGYDDDPFAPKDKELKPIYNCNKCSEDFEDYIINVDGINLRLINGELIYCENDNKK